ncbi:MAG: hypothetical protein WD535_02260, partial [Thermaerobacterales bacterium]
MYMVPVNEEIIGHLLGRSLYTDDGRTLLTAGTSLTERHVGALVKRGYSYIYLVNELAPDIKAEDPLTEETRRRATEHIHHVMETVRNSPYQDKNISTMSVQKITNVVDTIINELQDQSSSLLALDALRRIDDETLT